MRSPTAAVLLAGLLCCAAAGQQPAAPQQPPPGTPPRDMAKDQTPTPKPPEWPKEIEGKGIKDVLTAIEKETDPQGREVAVRMLPLFGPPGQKVLDKNGQNVAGRVLLRAMEKETDPGVRLAAYHTAALIGFAEEADTREAVRILSVAVEQGARGGQTRYHAVVALAAFGHKADNAVGALTGQAVGDSSYETRRAIAHTLGRVAFHEHRGPSVKALNTLCTTLANDASAAVRMEAMQSIVLLGPPFQPRPESAPLIKDVKDPKDGPKANEEAVKGFVTAIKKRITPTKAGGKMPETEKPVEIWNRLAVMRLEPKEVNDENLNGIAKYLAKTETDIGAKIQALTAFTLMGEVAVKKMTDIIRALDDTNPVVVEAALKALISMGPEAKGAIPAIEAIKGRGKEKEEKEMYTKWAEDTIKMIKMAKAPDKK
jgi:HEAT repeat protein